MSETSSEHPGTRTTNLDSLQIAPETIKYVFDHEVALRFGKQPYGGAAYCLSDVFPESANRSAEMAATRQALQTQRAMIRDPHDAAWHVWKARLWNVCAFGLSLGTEGGTVFLLEQLTALPSGDRYRPQQREARLWKTPPGVTATFVKASRVPEGTTVLNTITYDPGTMDERTVDTLYGAVLQSLFKISGQISGQK